MRAIRPTEYAEFKLFVQEGLIRYRNSKSVVAATELAQRILSYTPMHGWRWQLELEKRMAILRDAGVTPLMILQRVGEFYSLIDRHPHRVPTQRAERFTIARHCLHATPWRGTWRPSPRLMLELGTILQENLGLFGSQLVRRLYQDIADFKDLKLASVDFDSTNKQGAVK
ncbi:MAG: hypothetical protein WD051_14015 [Steroidobacteraceae bacterium]